MMTRDDFHFDFNEDAEPVEELHRLRVAMTGHFKTVKAIMEYTKTLPTPLEMIAELDMEIAEKKRKKRANRHQKRTALLSKSAAPRTTAGRGKRVNQLVHA